MKKHIIFVAMAVNALLLCYEFHIRAMDDKQKHEEQTEQTAHFLNDEQLAKLFGKAISDLHSELDNERAQERTFHVTLLSSIRSHKQYRNFNFDLEASMNKLIGCHVVDFSSITENSQQTESLNHLYRIHLETEVYKAANKELQSALEGLQKES